MTDWTFIKIFTDLCGLLLTYTPIIILIAIIILIINRRAKIRSHSPNPNSQNNSNNLDNPTVATLKRTSIYLLIDAALIIFFELVTSLGWDGTNYGAGTWGMAGYGFSILAAAPLIILFIFDLIRYLRSTDKTVRSNNLPIFAFSIFSIFALITTLFIDIVFFSLY